MKKKMILAVLCGMTLCLAACGNKDEKESDHKDAAESVIEFDQTSEAETTETKDTDQFVVSSIQALENSGSVSLG